MESQSCHWSMDDLDCDSTWGYETEEDLEDNQADDKCGEDTLFLVSICLENLVPTIYSEETSVFDVEMCVFYAAEGGILFLYPLR